MKALEIVLAALVVGSGCNGPGPADRAGDRLGGRHDKEHAADAGIPLPDVATSARVPAPPAPAGARPRVLVKAEARAIALYGTNVVYGDTVEDGVFVIPKAGGEAKRIARRSPISRTFAIDNEEISWVASPGDAVLKASLHTGAFPTTIRDRGIFADVAATGGDVFISEVVGAGGALTRITGPTAARLAAFDGPPRGLVVDATYAYIVTPTKIFRTPHVKGELETIATGADFEWPALSGDQLYVLGHGEGPKRRAILAIPKAGGAPVAIARDVRDAPIAIEGGELLWFDASRPQLRALVLADPKAAPRIVSEDDVLATANAIALDSTTAYVGTGSKDAGAIVTIARKP